MTNINILNDDLGIRGLQKTNKQPVTTGSVMPIKASNLVQASPENLPLKAFFSDRRGSEKRQADRRKFGSKVLLDTRTQHDRRTRIARKDDKKKMESSAILPRIDEII